MLENRDVYEVIEQDQYCLHVSVFKCMNTKIEKLKKELISSVHYNVEQLQKEYEEVYGEGELDLLHIIEDNNREQRFYNKLRRVLIAYIYNLQKVFKSKFVLNTMLTDNEKQELYVTTVLNNDFLLLSTFFIQYSTNENMKTIIKNYINDLHYEVTSKLKLTISIDVMIEDIRSCLN